MAVLQECSNPKCRKKQSLNYSDKEGGGPRKKCTACGKALGKGTKFHIRYYDDNGRQRQEFVGFSRTDAKKAMAKRETQKGDGTLWEALPEANMTFGDLEDWYLALEKVKMKRYFETLKHKLQNFNEEFGTKRVNDLKPVDLENYQTKKLAEGLKPATIDADVKAAQAMVNKAFLNDKASGNALKTFKKVKRLLKANSNARDRVLSPDEFDRFMEHLPEHLKGVVATAYYTGMRRGEILNLTWGQVDLMAKVIRLEAEDTKTHERRVVPIPDKLFEMLRLLPSRFSGSFVFQYHGKPIKDIRTGLKAAFEKAHIPYGHNTPGGFVFHDLRHTFNTNMRKAGVDHSVIMKITGHSTEAMFHRYNTVDLEDGRKAVDQLGDYLKNFDANSDQIVTKPRMDQEKTG